MNIDQGIHKVKVHEMKNEKNKMLQIWSLSQGHFVEYKPHISVE